MDGFMWGGSQTVPSMQSSEGFYIAEQSRNQTISFLEFKMCGPPDKAPGG